MASKANSRLPLVKKSTPTERRTTSQGEIDSNSADGTLTVSKRRKNITPADSAASASRTTIRKVVKQRPSKIEAAPYTPKNSVSGSYFTWDWRSCYDTEVETPAAAPGEVYYGTFRLKQGQDQAEPKFRLPNALKDLPAFKRQAQNLAASASASSITLTSKRRQNIQRSLTPPRSSLLEAPSNQELFQMYLEVTAPRLAGTSPSCVDIFHRDLPAMAQQSPALMGAMMALAAIQTSHLNKERKSIMANAQKHYDMGLQGNFAALLRGELMDTDIPLATSLLLSFYELWNGELVKMGVHMFGGRNIILARGKESHTTDVGRALLALFNRTDIGTSTITGNPCFLTNDWWHADPLTHITLHEDTPMLFACDVALSKLCLIYQKLTHLKRWALDRRRRVWKLAQSENCPDLSELRKKKLDLQRLVESKVDRLDLELEEWSEGLPNWFRPVQNEPDSDEDINDSLCPEVIEPKAHPHPGIALVIAMSYSIQLQLFRVSHPSPPVLPPHLGSRAHTILRIYEYLPHEFQVSILPFLFTAGIELRRPCHQGQLLARMQKDFQKGGLYALSFVHDALAYSFHKLASGPENRPSGGFVGVKEGAEVRFQGISENMWNAEGVLGMLEALSLYDSEDLEEGARYNYKGDFEIVVPPAETENDRKVGYEVIAARSDPSRAALIEPDLKPMPSINVVEFGEDRSYMHANGGFSQSSGVAMQHPKVANNLQPDHLSWQERSMLEQGLELSVDQY